MPSDFSPFLSSLRLRFLWLIQSIIHIQISGLSALPAEVQRNPCLKEKCEMSLLISSPAYRIKIVFMPSVQILSRVAIDFSRKFIWKFKQILKQYFSPFLFTLKSQNQSIVEKENQSHIFSIDDLHTKILQYIQIIQKSQVSTRASAIICMIFAINFDDQTVPRVKHGSHREKKMLSLFIGMTYKLPQLKCCNDESIY